MPTIIFKETEACNSNCIYCSVVARKKPLTISYELLELAFSRIEEYLINRPEEKMEIIWHGGEPCLAGLSFFYKVLELQEAYIVKSKGRVHHAIQSNLTLMNQDFIEVFKKMDILTIGTSYDPFDGIRGFGKNRDSLTYNKAFFKGINLLDRNNINWGFIFVTTKKVLDKPLEVFHILSNLKPTGGFNIHPVLIYKHEDKWNVEITPTEYANFLGAIFPVWWANRDRYQYVEPFKSYLDHYTTGGNLCCNDSGSCATSHVYIGPSGEASHCGRASDWDAISYGNITERSLIDIFNDELRTIFKNRKTFLPETECKDCEYWGICHGGCPLDSWNKHNDFSHKTEWCASNKVFFKKYFEPITGLKPQFNFKKEPFHE